MLQFLNKREVVNFSIAEGNYKMVSKKKFEVEREEKIRDSLLWRTELPDGSLTFIRKGWLGYWRTIAGGKTFSCSVAISCEYRGRKKHGKYKVILSSGNDIRVEVEGTFRNGKPHGMFRRYDFEGKFLSSCTFVNGKVLEYSLGCLRNSVVSRNKKKGTLHILMREETEAPSVHQVEWSGEENSFYSGKQCDLRFKTEWLTFKNGEERRREFLKDKEMRETKGKRSYFFGHYLTIEPTAQEY